MNLSLNLTQAGPGFRFEPLTAALCGQEKAALATLAGIVAFLLLACLFLYGPRQRLRNALPERFRAVLPYAVLVAATILAAFLFENLLRW